jgi:hypothetical protein
MLSAEFQVILNCSSSTRLLGNYPVIASFYLPTRYGGERLLKDGEIIELFGRDVVYTRRLIASGIPLREIGVEVGWTAFNEGFDEGFE